MAGSLQFVEIYLIIGVIESWCNCYLTVGLLLGVFSSLKASYEEILWERISLSLTLREMLSHTLLNDSSSLEVSKKYA